MSKGNIGFWLALLEKGGSDEQRIRLWNGYIHWKLTSDFRPRFESQSYKSIPTISPPVDGWPELTLAEKVGIEALAEEHGGHPEVSSKYMDFSDHVFVGEVDFSDLVLVNSCFDNVKFDLIVDFNNSRFCNDTSFYQAQFKRQAFFHGAKFDGSTRFMGAKFSCGCSFSGASFEAAWFHGVQFSARGFSPNMSPGTLVDFTNVKFTSQVDFREAVFGDTDSKYSRNNWPERVVDFSGAKFTTRASFYKATFASAPAFFDTILHADTIFDGVNWEQGESTRVPPGYAVRAWERLELMMSQLEKPLDRHRFFRLKMRYRRQTDGPMLWVFNTLFDWTCDYGWGVQRAFVYWICHWLVFAIVLFANTGSQTTIRDYWQLGWAALGIAFANGHAFLGLAEDGGYLESSRRVLECNDVWGLLTIAGIVQAVLGPTLLFLVLLTLCNRFRLA